MVPRPQTPARRAAAAPRGPRLRPAPRRRDARRSALRRERRAAWSATARPRATRSRWLSWWRARGGQRLVGDAGPGRSACFVRDRTQRRPFPRRPFTATRAPRQLVDRRGVRVERHTDAGPLDRRGARELVGRERQHERAERPAPSASVTELLPPWVTASRCARSSRTCGRKSRTSQPSGIGPRARPGSAPVAIAARIPSSASASATRRSTSSRTERKLPKLT